jgi:hypothetical protein
VTVILIARWLSFVGLVLLTSGAFVNLVLAHKGHH